PPGDMSMPARYARAISSYRHSDLRSAIGQIDALIQMQPNNPYFHELKGQALLEGGRAAEAIAPLRRAVEDARAALAAFDLEGWHQASLRFHDGLVALAANRHLTRLHEELKTSLRRYQISVIGPSGEPERFQVEHDAILEAIEGGRIERGLELVAAHITNLKEALLKAIAGTA
ncbi:MAG: FCD domain-containing protein, partial [Gammaproteobacteria bacterium]